MLFVNRDRIRPHIKRARVEQLWVHPDDLLLIHARGGFVVGACQHRGFGFRGSVIAGLNVDELANIDFVVGRRLPFDCLPGVQLGACCLGLDKL